MKKMLTIGTLLFCSMVTQITRPIESELIRQKYRQYEAAAQQKALEAKQAAERAARRFKQGAQDIGTSFREGAKKFKFW